MESLSSNTNHNSGTRKACGACRARRRRCDSRCVFADVIPHNEPHKYTTLCQMYNIKWIEEGLSQLWEHKVCREYYVRVLLEEDGHTWFVKCSRDDSLRDASIYSRKRRSQPCGACKEKKRECKSNCVFAGAISYQEPEKYQKLNKVFNIKWIEEVLLSLNDDQRVEVVNLFLSEADRLNELVHSLLLRCEDHICIACPPQDVGDNLLSLSEQYQLEGSGVTESWGGIILS